MASESAEGFSRLTARQRSILELIAHGLTNPQIGIELHMSKHTVAQHIKEIFRRTGAVNRADLVNQAHAVGLLQGQAGLNLTRQRVGSGSP